MAKKKKIYIEPEKDLTTMLFTSLMLILLTFFIVLTSMGVQDSKKERLAMNSLLGSFGILPGGSSPYKSQQKGSILPQSDPLSPTPVRIQQVRAVIKERGLTEGTGVSEGSLGTIITMRDNVLFDKGADQLKPGSRDVLNAIASVLDKVDNHVMILGHTDSIPMEDPPFYSNRALSAARGMAVLSYLASRGVAYDRMVAYGMGSQRPMTSNSTAQGRQLNRRVEITILGSLPEGAHKGIEAKEKPPVNTFQYKGFKFRLEEQ
ncbi:MAG: OmpA family protein [Thermodesulfobacteriota bacterium]|nr:OmpA family protein [Thermodesulfobacteriota bacterium]